MLDDSTLPSSIHSITRSNSKPSSYFIFVAISISLSFLRSKATPLLSPYSWLWKILLTPSFLIVSYDIDNDGSIHCFFRFVRYWILWSSTDSSLYSLQYVGAPAVWTANVVGENISISSQNAVGYANVEAYSKAKDKFYKYDGRSSPLKCDVRRYVINDFNTEQ